MSLSQKVNQEKLLQVIEAGSEIDQEWERYVSNHPDGTVYHHPIWLQTLEKEYNHKVIRLVCKNSNGEIEGVMPISYTKGIPLGIGGLPASKRISSLPRTPLAGPLSLNAEASKILLRKAKAFLEKEKNSILQIKSMDSNLNELAENLEVIPWRSTYIKILPENPDKLRFGNSRNHNRIKWAINKANKSGVEIKKADSIEELKEWYKLYSNTMRWHVVPVRSFRYFKILWNEMRPKGLMDLLLAVHTENNKSKMIAGSMIFKFNKTVFYAFNGREKDSLSLRPNDFLQWHAMHQACEEGFSYYDLGEVSSDNEGLDKFKSKWDCEVKQLYHYYSPSLKLKQDKDIDPGSSGELAKFIWQKLPLIITQKLSDTIYKYL